MIYGPVRLSDTATPNLVSHGFTPILMLNVVMGIGNGIAMPAGFVITGKLGREMGMGAVMGITDAGWSLGMIASPILSGLIMDSLGLSQIFLVGGILIIIGSGLIVYFLRGPFPKALHGDHPNAA